MDRNLTNSQKLERVEEVMMEVRKRALQMRELLALLHNCISFQMNLKHIENTLIGQGDRLKGISGN